MSAAETYLGAVALQRPDLAATLAGETGLHPEELRSAAVRRLLELALSLGEAEAFPLHRLGPADQALASRLLLQPIPELGPGVEPQRLRRALSDAVWRCREAALVGRIGAVQRERRVARDGGRTGEAETLAMRLRELSGELQRVRAHRQTPVAGAAEGRW